jgi:hypothetical protein
MDSDYDYPRPAFGLVAGTGRRPIMVPAEGLPQEKGKRGTFQN